jgi:hypothetical protein
MFPPDNRILAALIRHEDGVIRWEALAEGAHDPVQLPSHHCNQRLPSSGNKSLSRMGACP